MARPRSDMKLSILERLWAHVDTSGECWLWVGANDGKDGYGRVRLPDDGVAKAHRIAWELAYGVILDGMVIAHACDTPACVRPSHLFLATHLENCHDAMRKHRLTYKVIPIVRERAIARIVNGECSQATIARELGINPATVSRWISCRKWEV